MKILFTEKQRFTQWWLWAIMIAVNVLMLYGFVQQIIFGIPFGDKPAPDLALIIVGLIPFGVSWLIYSFCLETKITDEFIAYEFKPMTSLKTIRWEEIDKAYIREYSPLREFGGWGFRYSFKNGQAYNVKGNQGLQLELKNGKKILIGTQKAMEMQDVLTNLNIH